MTPDRDIAPLQKKKDRPGWGAVLEETARASAVLMDDFLGRTQKKR